MPTTIDNATSGKSAKDTTVDALKNLGTNVAFNVGGEALGAGIDALKKVDLKKIKADKQAQKALQKDLQKRIEEVSVKPIANKTNTIGKNASVSLPRTEIPTLNDTVKEITTNTDDALKSSNTTLFPEFPTSQKVSKTKTNTMTKSGIETEIELSAKSPDVLFTYEPKSEIDSAKEAIKNIQKNGIDATKNTLMKKENFSGVDTDTMMYLWQDAVKKAQSADAVGENSNVLWKSANDIFKKVQTQSSTSGQALQALAKWSRSTPVGMLSNAENIINLKTTGKQGSKLADALKKYLPKNGVELSPEFQKNFLNIAEKIQNIGNLENRESKELMAQLGKLVNSQIPSKLPERVSSFLIDNMLGNFRTLITRNAGGNIGFNVLEQLKKPIASGIDTVISAKTGKRTVGNLSGNGLYEYLSGMVDGLKNEGQDLITGLHTARSGETTLENAITSNRHVFATNSKNPILKVGSFLADKADSLVKNGLSIGDRPFYEGTYKQILYEYKQLYKSGKMGDIIQNLSEDEFEEYAKTAAKMNALASVYQDDTLLAQGLMKIKNGISDISNGALGVDILSQFSMPFVKTPANLITRAIEYSPFGTVKNAISTGKELATKNFDQMRFANETARNILGTGIFGAGIGMAKNGLLTGGYSDDKDMKNAQKQSGMQEYALNVNNKNSDIGFIPVVGNDLVASAAMYDKLNKNPNAPLLEQIGTGTQEGLNSLLNQSVFQGMQRIFGGNNSYNSDKGLLGNVGDSIKSGVTQVIPSLVRQSAQVSDKYERQLSGANDNDYYINSFKNSIPVIREDLQPKIDNKGNKILQNQGRSIANKILENMILPGKITENTQDDVTSEAMRLFNSISLDKSSVVNPKISFLPTASRKDIGTPTDEQFTPYQVMLGKTNYSLASDLINSDYYKNLSDDEKATELANVYSISKKITKHEMINSDLNDNEMELYNAFKKQGSQAVIDNMQLKSNLKQYGFTTGSKKAVEAYEKGGEQGLQQYTNDKQLFDDLGLSMNSDKLNAYYDSYGADGLKQLAEVKSIADSDMNKSISNDELIPTLNYLGYNGEQGGQMIQALGGELSKQAQQAYTDLGNDGVYQYYNNKHYADYDGNGSLKKEELIYYLQQTYSSRNEMAYWFDRLKPPQKGKSNHNPFY